MASDEVVKSLTPSQRVEQSRRLNKEKGNLLRDVPSIVWFEDKWHHGVAFPPGGDRTRMHRCAHCERFTPPNSLNLIEVRESRQGEVVASAMICDDCHDIGQSDMAEQIHEAGIFKSAPNGSFIDQRSMNHSRNPNGRAYKGGI